VLLNSININSKERLKTIKMIMNKYIIFTQFLLALHMLLCGYCQCRLMVGLRINSNIGEYDRLRFATLFSIKIKQ